MIKCARCGLLNPDGATLCECGFDLVHGDAAAVRGVLKRKGRLHIAGGALLIVLGLLGGMAWLPVHFTLSFRVNGYRIDLVCLIAGGLLIARGARILERPWDVKQK
jgi:hypothetical protein